MRIGWANSKFYVQSCGPDATRASMHGVVHPAEASTVLCGPDIDE